jgi:hypothetical protein
MARRLSSPSLVGRTGHGAGADAVLSVERSYQLASGDAMSSILMNAVAAQQPHRPAQPVGMAAGAEVGTARSGMAEWAAGVGWGCRIVGGSRPRKPPGFASTWMRSSGCGPSGKRRC